MQNSEIKNLSGRGGYREGAGRPAKSKETKNVAVSFSLPPDLAERIRQVPDKSKLVQHLLREHFGRLSV